MPQGVFLLAKMGVADHSRTCLESHTNTPMHVLAMSSPAEASGIVTSKMRQKAQLLGGPGQLGDSSMVEQRTLTLLMYVRILVPQPRITI